MNEFYGKAMEELAPSTPWQWPSHNQRSRIFGSHNANGVCSSIPFNGFSSLQQYNSHYSMVGRDFNMISYSGGGNSRMNSVYGGAGSLVLDGARGELVNASKIMTPKEILEAKAAAASKSHSEAERRRRERINNHLATLRTLLPSTTKTDKASLLAEVIEHLKDLKRRASEIEKGSALPSDVDELKVEANDKEDLEAASGFVIRASLCCDDRPDLLTDLNRTLHSLRLRAVKAEISTLGGRTKNVFIMKQENSITEKDKDKDNPSLSRVQEALRAVMERAAASSSPTSTEAFTSSSSKRQRTLQMEAIPTTTGSAI